MSVSKKNLREHYILNKKHLKLLTPETENISVDREQYLIHLRHNEQWWVVLLTQRDDGQPLEREQGWATFVVYVLPPLYTDWGGESGDRRLTTPSRPRLRPLSHPQFVQVAIVTDLNTWKDE